jgi:hypothetical protein
MNRRQSIVTLAGAMAYPFPPARAAAYQILSIDHVDLFVSDAERSKGFLEGFFVRL